MKPSCETCALRKTIDVNHRPLGVPLCTAFGNMQVTLLFHGKNCPRHVPKTN